MTYRIEQARKEKGWTQDQLAEAMNTSSVQISRWETGKRDPQTATLIKIANALGVSLDYLAGVERTPTNAVPARPGGVPRPVIGRISAGPFGTVYEESGEELDVPDDVWECHKQGFWMRVSGNSMNRLFAEGSMVYVDPACEVRNGDVGVACVNGDEGTVKRIFFEPNNVVRLHPESYDPEYRDRVIDEDDPESPSFHIEGKVVSYRAPMGWRA